MANFNLSDEGHQKMVGQLNALFPHIGFCFGRPGEGYPEVYPEICVGEDLARGTEGNQVIRQLLEGKLAELKLQSDIIRQLLEIVGGSGSKGMAKCDICGAELEDDWDFCPYDGVSNYDEAGEAERLKKLMLVNTFDSNLRAMEAWLDKAYPDVFVSASASKGCLIVTELRSVLNRAIAEIENTVDPGEV